MTDILAETNLYEAALWVGQYVLSDQVLRRAYMVTGETEPVYVHRVASLRDADVEPMAAYREASAFAHTARVVTASMSAAQGMSGWEVDVRAKAIEQVAVEIERVLYETALDGSPDGDFDLSDCDALAEIVRRQKAA